MKTTAFTQFHIEAGAKMSPFAGFNMPIEYSGINEEHLTVRQGVGVFDVSHMGEIWVKGPNALKFLQYVTTNDVAALSSGKVQYSCMPNGRGGIVDDLLVYCIDEQTYLLVVNASNIDKDWNHLLSFAGQFGLNPGKELYNASDEIALLAVQGPKAIEVIQKLVDTDISAMPYYTFGKVNVAGISNAILSITGYTGAGGCEIYVANEDGAKLWKAVFEAGKDAGIKPVGLGARDTLRVEMGYCLYGNDIDDNSSPIEAGLGWITKFKADKDFVDKDVLMKQKSEGTLRRLVGFEMIDKGVPRQHYEIYNSVGERIGEVSSGTMSPSMKKGVGLGYVQTAYSKPDSEIYIKIREKLLKAMVVKLPILKVGN
ncbi:MAG: glycine cleavage system aminomethyltransferase GcvT [Prevotellaceae bacterium]|jgi:aminomethyltransferase|nr:glycine cleavage system aminomethyltransferase GcvT [Prevotellaceae bacterium]